jgi:hypothetical protein
LTISYKTDVPFEILDDIVSKLEKNKLKRRKEKKGTI